MTKPVSRRMAVDCLLERIIQQFGKPLHCLCGEPMRPDHRFHYAHFFPPPGWNKAPTRTQAVNGILRHVLDQFGTPLLCPECKEPLLPGEVINFDHVHQVATGGGHHYSRLRPIHYDPCHKKKNRQDSRARKKIRHIRGEVKGRPQRPWTKGRKLQGRGFQKKAKS